jgi:hypothetical protein
VSHTPGPWVYDGFSPHEGWVVELPGFGSGGRNIKCEGWSAEEAEANARLVAAAPDLLEALRRIEMLDRRVYAGVEVEGWNWDEAIFAARDAILKATEGES